MLSRNEINSRREEASELRALGKEFHDEGDLTQAASLFDKAASILNSLFSNLSSRERNLVNDDQGDDVLIDEISQEAATCRLHQALCALKNQEYQTCIDACTSLLDDDNIDREIDKEHEKTDEDILNRNEITKLTFTKPHLSAAIRARAHHRRAKARLGLSDTDGALEDARTAAFLGDRGAVALYGRLMREKGSGYGLGAMGFGMDGEDDVVVTDVSTTAR